jgi:hypothetical protein
VAAKGQTDISVAARPAQGLLAYQLGHGLPTLPQLSLLPRCQSELYQKKLDLSPRAAYYPGGEKLLFKRRPGYADTLSPIYHTQRIDLLAGCAGRWG